jgi:hypothetical protein
MTLYARYQAGDYNEADRGRPTGFIQLYPGNAQTPLRLLYARSLLL